MKGLKQEKVSAFPNNKVFLTFSGKNIVQILLLMTGLLVVCHLVSVYLMGWSLQMERTFNLDFENNIPTWFSSFLWTLAAFIAYSCSQQPCAPKEKRTWITMSILFVCLACDEVASLHENIGLVLGKRFFSLAMASSLGMRAWPIVLAPVIAGGLLWVTLRMRLCLRNSPKASKQLIFGSALFLTAAAGLEVLIHFLMEGNLLRWFWKIEIPIEESLEMLGVIIIITGLFTHNQVLAERSKQAKTAFQTAESKRTVICQV